MHRVLTSPASVWARPFLLFALLDVLLWQSVAQGGYDTAITVAAGSTLLIAVLAMRWLDAWLPYGALIFAAIGVGNVAAWLGLSWAQSLALAGGIGFVLYLTGWAAEWLSARINALTVWPRSLAGALRPRSTQKNAPRSA